MVGQIQIGPKTLMIVDLRADSLLMLEEELYHGHPRNSLPLQHHQLRQNTLHLQTLPRRQYGLERYFENLTYLKQKQQLYMPTTRDPLLLHTTLSRILEQSI